MEGNARFKSRSFQVNTLTMDPSRRRTGLPLQARQWGPENVFLINTAGPGEGNWRSHTVSLPGANLSDLEPLVRACLIQWLSLLWLTVLELALAYLIQPSMEQEGPTHASRGLVSSCRMEEVPGNTRSCAKRWVARPSCCSRDATSLCRTWTAS